MALFKNALEAFVASREWDQATLTRLTYWLAVFGERDMASITPNDVDAAMVKLAERGRLKGGKRATSATGEPLSGATLNRYLSQLGSVFKYARRLRLLPRAFLSPTRGIEREPERADAERYVRPEQFDRLLAVARVVDRRWGKMPALMLCAYHTGWRVGSLLALRGRDMDLEAGTITVARTKNGDPASAALSSAAVVELKKLSKVAPDELVFGNRAGKPFTYDPLWTRITREAGFPGRGIHQLRHGFGYRLARAGVSQQLLMQCMGHRSLAASQRYAHASTSDKQAVIARVFG